MLPFPLKLKHRVHHVLNHFRSGNDAFFRHMADKKHRDAARLRNPHECGCRFTHLADGPGRTFKIGTEHGLDGIHDDQVRRLLRDHRLYDVEIGFSEQEKRFRGLDRESLRTQLDLSDGFFPGDVKRDAPECGRHLHHQRRLADAGVASDKNHGTRDDPPSQHAVKFGDPYRRTGLGSDVDSAD